MHLLLIVLITATIVYPKTAAIVALLFMAMVLLDMSNQNKK